MTTCFIAVFVTCWLLLILKKIMNSTKSKKNQKTIIEKIKITNKKLWIKIILYALKSTVDSIL